MAKFLSHGPESNKTQHKMSGSRTDVAPVFKDFVAPRWVEENRESIAAFNKEIEARGVWSEGIRSW